MILLENLQVSIKRLIGRYNTTHPYLYTIELFSSSFHNQFPLAKPNRLGQYQTNSKIKTY